MENRILRERLRRLESENCSLREANFRLQSRLAESRLVRSLPPPPQQSGGAGADGRQEPASGLAEAQSAIRALCAHVEAIKSEADERTSELEHRLDGTIREKCALQVELRTRRQRQQDDDEAEPASDGDEESVVPDDADQEQAEEEDEDEWALFASREFSADLERDHRNDERSVARSRAERASQEKDARTAELEDVLLGAKKKTEAAGMTETTSASALPRVAAERQESSLRGGQGGGERMILLGKPASSLGSGKSGVAAASSSPVPPIPGEGLERNTSRAQMA